MSTQISFSASDLVKRSARQIKYLRDNKEIPKPTKRQLQGNEEALEKSVGYVEMRGTFELGDLIIRYTFDEIQSTLYGHRLIEHKMLINDSERWYINSCILQMAFYYSLHMENDDMVYETATFFVNKGHSKEELRLTKKVKAILVLGDNKYQIDVTDTEALVDFYLQKAMASLDWDDAQVWDSKYKRKEYEYLKEYIVVCDYK